MTALRQPVFLGQLHPLPELSARRGMKVHLNIRQIATFSAAEEGDSHAGEAGMSGPSTWAFSVVVLKAYSHTPHPTPRPAKELVRSCARAAHDKPDARNEQAFRPCQWSLTDRLSAKDMQKITHKNPGLRICE